MIKSITRSRIKKFISEYSSDKPTLDIGCGASPYSHLFTNRTSIDVKHDTGVDVVGDVHKMPFEDSTFDIILCTEVLEHLHTPQDAINEMRRVLRPDGVVILTTRFIYPLHGSPVDYYRFTKYGLMHLFKDWKILSLKSETTTKDTFAVLLQALARKTVFRGGKITRKLVFLLARLILFSPSLIKKELRTKKSIKEETDSMSSGYYMVCRNKKEEAI